jgi:hypothetical protein
MQISIHNDAGYSAYKAVVDSFGCLDRVYYSKNGNGVLRIDAICLGFKHGISVAYDDSQGPSEVTLLGDYPEAIETAITGIAY